MNPDLFDGWRDNATTNQREYYQDGKLMRYGSRTGISIEFMRAAKRPRMGRMVRLQATELSMSGRGSRARRVEATRRAYADVYRLRGAEMPPPPFGNERQDRIYAQQYAKYRRSYWHMERMLAELAEVYGYPAMPRPAT